MAMFIADDYLPLEEANHYTRALAGAELNVSVGLVRLGYRVGWISRLGTDPLGRYILNQVRQAGLDTTRVLFDERYPTGFQLKSRVREGDPMVVYFRKSSVASHMAPNKGRRLQAQPEMFLARSLSRLTIHCGIYQM